VDGLSVADVKIVVGTSFATKFKNRSLISSSDVASPSAFGYLLEIGLNSLIFNRIHGTHTIRKGLVEQGDSQ
jgi:hypothetical protein